MSSCGLFSSKLDKFAVSSLNKRNVIEVFFFKYFCELKNFLIYNKWKKSIIFWGKLI